jgi:hypothetical protein
VTDEHKDQDELTAEELDDQDATALPDREVMSTLNPPIDPIGKIGIGPLPPEVE